MPPVRGSRATTAPRRPPRAATAAAWRSRSRCRVKFCPARGRSIQDAGDAPAGVRFDPFMSHCTMQRALVVGLYAKRPINGLRFRRMGPPLKIGLGQTAYAPTAWAKSSPSR